MGTHTFALAGNPNCGKTTLFNALTGGRQHVGNYPGVTVEKKVGTCSLGGNPSRIVDLPGIYSLTAYSVEEVVARNYLSDERPDAVINIVDASNLERNLYLSCQLMELGVPMVVACNMMDVARSRGLDIDLGKLSRLLGVEVVAIVARNSKGLDELMAAAGRVAAGGASSKRPVLSYGDDIDRALLGMVEIIQEKNFLTATYPARWLALKYLEGDGEVCSQGAAADPEADRALRLQVEETARHLRDTLDTYPEAVIADHRYGFIKAILQQDVVRRQFDASRLYVSDRIDLVLTHRFVGPLVMVAVLLGLYHFTFTYSELPVAWLENVFAWAGDVVDGFLADGPFKSLLMAGIIDGVGGVLGFVPLIMFMFFGIAFLEDSGYLARVAFMLDRVFRMFGLHGSSVMPYIVSGGIAGGCAVPGVLATRTLRSPKERLATLLTAPFMNCGAKLPVLALLIGAFFAEHEAVFLLGLTALAWVMALLVAKVLRHTVLRGEPTPFVMELPPYRFPTFRGLLIHTWEKTWQYVKKAGTVILGISVLLWAMMTYPGLPEGEVARFETDRASVVAAGGEAERVEQRLAAIDGLEAEAALKNSLAGRLGRSLESVSYLAGFDWRTNIALVGGFAAKEVVVSTLGTAYSLGEVDPESGGSLAKTLAADPGWSPVTALALVVFVMFYAPCFVTVVCISREAGSWKWGAFAMAFNTVFAFLFAVGVFQIGSLLYA